MRDPLEGLTPEGWIRTGASRERIPGRYLPVLDGVVARVAAHAPGASVHVYGSVANGTAVSPTSDVDLLTVGLAADRAAALGAELSANWSDVCRGVEIGTAMPTDFHGDRDEAYGMRVFLHHYCVHLSGPEIDRATAPFAGDRRAARGFNGDIAQHARRWRAALLDDDPSVLGRRVARKSLLAVAGLVSVQDATWTTDRELAARRWADLHHDLAPGLRQLTAWSSQVTIADRAELRLRLDDTIDPIVGQFAADVGLWRE